MEQKDLAIVILAYRGAHLQDWTLDGKDWHIAGSDEEYDICTLDSKE